MNNLIKISIPAVKDVIHRAEEEIERITGVQVALSIEHVAGEIISGAGDTQRVAGLICDHFGITWKDMTSASRKGDLVLARECFVYYNHKDFEGILTTATLARILKKDHTSIIWYKQKIRDFTATKDVMFCRAIARIDKRLLQA